ncbi:hypothetical protein [Streptomyces coffeae]|uniref:YbbD head domain-containing protein n=1 Tax=Streptomyces coffeae TaxID=621382 RepID=A0ABS1N7N2_9ACTN|nr:hypothetical protein [Streptomyces coffeae]MBL1096087.1 hypothetical protein [Streptomyces coffeae]
MRINKWAVAVIGVAAMTLTACSDETTDVRYKTHADAAKEVQHGWLPGWVPKDVTNIRMRYNVGNNATSIRFTLGQQELPSACHKAQGKSVKAPTEGQPDWWPENFDGYTFYRCSDDGEDTKAAVHDGTAYVWSEAS